MAKSVPQQSFADTSTTTTATAKGEIKSEKGEKKESAKGEKIDSSQKSGAHSRTKHERESGKGKGVTRRSASPLAGLPPLPTLPPWKPLLLDWQ